jgi:phosphoketolase
VVEGDPANDAPAFMAAATDKAIEEIQRIQGTAKDTKDTTRPRWPSDFLCVCPKADLDL